MKFFTWITVLFSMSLGATEGIQFFEDEVLPVLKEHCIKCHGPEKEKGGLRLDIPEGILAGGDSGKLFDHESRLLTAVKRLDEDLEMPPKNALPQKDVKTLEKWVAMGTPMPKSANPVKLKQGYDWQEELKHWAYQKPKKSAVPANQYAIDYFIDRDLKKLNLSKVRKADKIELIRRASFDLTGLPPAPSDVDAFLNDKSSGAFEKVIDRLLTSPQFGERWARHWLDVARYGDDQPYAFQQKLLSNAWKYRDWVVKAFNEDLPYSEFIRRQLAADLISGLEPEEQAATGLIATGPMYFKRTEVLKALADELDDRIDVVTKGFLGLTVSCARCHDHKFDAIPTKDYYALAGVFKSTRIYDRMVASQEEIAEYHRRLLQQGNLKSQLKELVLKYNSAAPQQVTIDGGIEIDDRAAVKKGQWKSSTYFKGFSGKSYLTDSNKMKGKSSITFPLKVRKSAEYELYLSYNYNEQRASNVPVEIHHTAGVKKLSVDQTQKPRYKNKYVSIGTYRLDSKKPGKVIISNAGTKGFVIADSVLIVPRGKAEVKRKPLSLPVYSGPSPVFSTDLISPRSRDHRGFVDVNIAGLKEIYLVTEYLPSKSYKFHFHSWMNPVIRNGKESIKLTGIKPEVMTDNKFYGAKFDTGEDAIICNGEVITSGFHCSGNTVMKFKLPAGDWQRFKAEAGVFAKNGGAERNNRVRFHVFKENPSKWLERRSQLQKPGDDFYLSADTSKMSTVDAGIYKSLINRLKTEKPSLPPLVHGLWEGEIRNMKVNIRGNPKKLGEEVPRGFLRVLNNGQPLNFTNGSGRLQLAELIANKNNPLTARVMVNRIWHSLFGRGIVNSPSNFGKPGDKPSNQELLDWMAVEFMDQKWSVKKMIKTIMLSEAYQRSSEENSANNKVDADNKYFWRQNLKRLDAESLRDSILAVSGRLVNKVGGSPVSSSFDSSSFNRRMLYARVSRTAPDSMRATFDFPSSSNSAPKRNITTVPQQKLFYLNSSFIMEMAKHLSKRIAASNTDHAKQLQFAFKTLYSRLPTREEETRLLPIIKGSQQDRDLLAQVLLISNEFSYID